MKFKHSFRRLKEENFSPLFVLSRAFIWLNIKLPLTVNLDSEINGKIYLHPSPFPHKLFLKKNTYKSDNAVVKKFVKDGDIVFDVGADLGALSILFSHLCGKSGRVFAFEPTKRTFGFLEDNIKLNGLHNIVAVNAAVSDTSGEASFVEHKYSHGFNHVGGAGSGNIVKVPTLRLDSLLLEYNISKINFLKIDTEGFELPVLKSLGGRVKDVKTVYFEFHSANCKRAGYDANKIIDFLDSNNFEVHIPEQHGNELKLIPFKKQQNYPQKLNLLAMSK